MVLSGRPRRVWPTSFAGEVSPQLFPNRAGSILRKDALSRILLSRSPVDHALGYVSLLPANICSPLSRSSAGGSVVTVYVEDWQAAYGAPYLVRPEDQGAEHVELVEDGG